MPASTVTEYLAALPADGRDALNEDVTLGRKFKHHAGFGSIYVIHVYHKRADIRERLNGKREEPSSKLKPRKGEERSELTTGTLR
jgi:hypothetical protein